MTWTVNAQGHHNTADWKKEEADLLRRVVEAITVDDTVVCSTFTFYGNHVGAKSLEDAKKVLSELDE